MSAADIKEHDIVELTHLILEEGLIPGDVGTVVHIYPDNLAYEVEFSPEGMPTTVLTLEPKDIRLLTKVKNESIPCPSCKGTGEFRINEHETVACDGCAGKGVTNLF
jgi:hypothetical protein